MDKVEPPQRNLEDPFLLSVDSVYNISGRGTVACGTIEQGKVKVGDALEILGGKIKIPIQTNAIGVETFQKTMDQGEAGDSIGVLLRGIKYEQIKRGMILAKPKTFKSYRRFKGQCYILKAEEGGRTKGFFSNYIPQLFLRTAD